MGLTRLLGIWAICPVSVKTVEFPLLCVYISISFPKTWSTLAPHPPDMNIPRDILTSIRTIIYPAME